MISILVCGGTFDKQYDEITGRLFFKDTHVPEMLPLGRSRVEVSIRTLMMMDSLDMTDADRDAIVQQCQMLAEQRIVTRTGPTRWLTPPRRWPARLSARRLC